ncbi:hypothetical protein MnTg02_02125 [bacterium MnTg02]|nr:hypothetical protein MnTg02_02125 [bacterium MnTg02]
MPNEPGAYILALEIEKAFTLAIRTLPKPRLRAGYYLYCGSANGPGGLRARIGRHFRKRKSRHWHIDRLTERATNRAALILPRGDECALAHLIGGRANMQTPVPGFGATDCRQCESHLFFCGEL